MTTQLMINLIIDTLPSFRFVDALDIFLSALLFYSVYKLIKGTNAINIFLGFFIIFIIWKIVNLFQMRLLSEIIGQFISVGVIALIIIFQPEIRRFLLLLGTRSISNGKRRKFLWWRIENQDKKHFNSTAIVQSYQHLSQQKTGALVVISRFNDLESIIQTGEIINSELSSQLIETIFFKNTPLHDGAVIVSGNRILAARCILPVSSNSQIPANLGLRHRSAIGITEQTDSLAVVVSEQTGGISVVKGGIIEHNISPSRLQEFLDKELNS
ncbi:MAG: diadenylate cyclase CdaA [Bacteroidales bacterium]